MSRRWIRLDVTCFESEWLVGLPPAAQHLWTRLLLYVKANGHDGRAKALGPSAVFRLWGISDPDRLALLEAAHEHGSLRTDDGDWVVTGWVEYQKVDKTAADRMKRHRSAMPVTPVTRNTGVTGRNPSRDIDVDVDRESTSTPLAVRGAKRPRQKAEYSPEFEAAWGAYPKRAGGNPKPKAWSAWLARVKQGVLPEELAAAVERYAAFARATGKEGTEFVMQGATFFGPGERWKADYAPPVPATPPAKTSWQDRNEEAALETHRAWVKRQGGRTIPIMEPRKVAQPAPTPDSAVRPKGNLEIRLPPQSDDGFAA